MRFVRAVIVVLVGAALLGVGLLQLDGGDEPRCGPRQVPVDGVCVPAPRGAAVARTDPGDGRTGATAAGIAMVVGGPVLIVAGLALLVRAYRHRRMMRAPVVFQDVAMLSPPLRYERYQPPPYAPPPVPPHYPPPTPPPF